MNWLQTLLFHTQLVPLRRGGLRPGARPQRARAAHAGTSGDRGGGVYKLNPGDPLVPVALAPGNNKNNHPCEAETRCPGFKLTHTTEWKHPWFEPLKLTRDVLVSVSEFALKWVNSYLLRAGKPVLRMSEENAVLLRHSGAVQVESSLPMA